MVHSTARDGFQFCLLFGVFLCLRQHTIIKNNLPDSSLSKNRESAMRDQKSKVPTQKTSPWCLAPPEKSTL